MEASISAVMRACTTDSDEERVTFGHIVGQLLAAGVERYHVDLCRAEKTYYLPTGESLVDPCLRFTCEVARAFAPPEVVAAIRASQMQQIRYREFCRRIMAAGCVGYVVSLVGRRAVYFGRSGEMNVEHFPPAAP